jgi:hypothetical protein
MTIAIDFIATPLVNYISRDQLQHLPKTTKVLRAHSDFVIWLAASDRVESSALKVLNPARVTLIEK